MGGTVHGLELMHDVLIDLKPARQCPRCGHDTFPVKLMGKEASSGCIGIRSICWLERVTAGLQIEVEAGFTLYLF